MRLTYLKYTFALFLLIFLIPAFGAGGGGGGTVPWPWPWAEECPIDFESLQGTWVMSGKSSESYLRIGSTWVPDRRAQYLVIEMVNGHMETYARGFTFTNGTARTILVALRDMGGVPIGLLELKVYHRTHVASCDSRELVPIVTFRSDRGSTQSHYVLKKRGLNSPEENP